MTERSPAEAELVAAMAKTLDYIQTHLDDPLTPHGLADAACYSLPYFHRVFRAIVGESVMDHIRRLRLEKAAYRLRTGHESIGAIALDAGYGAQEAFTRIFQAYFGIGPRMFRYIHASYLLPAVSGVHFSPTGQTRLRRAVEPALLDDAGLCPAHRHLLAGRDPLEQLLGIVTEFHFAEWPQLPYGTTNPWLENDMSESLKEFDQEIHGLMAEVDAAKQRLLDARKRRPKEPVVDYVLLDGEGHGIHLSELFGNKRDLIVVHNMGASCIYCTVWADGITGLVPHFADRTALVVCSPDGPEEMRRFAEKRNWTFRMVSAAHSSFPKDMGFWQEAGPMPGPWPGVSVFKKEADGTIYRVAKSFLGSADGQSTMWPLFEMLDKGLDGWEPKFDYAAS